MERGKEGGWAKKGSNKIKQEKKKKKENGGKEEKREWE